MKELKFEELSVKQKIGMVSCALIAGGNRRTDEGDEFVLDLIRNHALGAIWVNPKTKNFPSLFNSIDYLSNVCYYKK